MSIHDDPSRNLPTEKLEGLSLGGGDCFNDLPDDLLVHIISFLSTKQAVRTSAVSKRWQRLCGPVPVPSLTIKIPHHLLNICYGHTFLDEALALHASPSRMAALTTLRVLDVSHVTWSDDLVANLLAGCPALASLRMRRFRGIRRIDATSATKLEELVMECCLEWDEFPFRSMRNCNLELSICAPHLQELKLTEIWQELSPVLINVDSLVKAELDFTIVHAGRDHRRNTVRKLLAMVRQCEELKVGPFCLQVLSPTENDLSRTLLSSPKHVMVHIGFSISFNPLGLYNLLQCFPTLERLTVDLISVHDKDLTESPGCLLSNLKVVKLFEFAAIQRWIKFAKFLLKNSPILEKLVIYPNLYSSSNTENLCKAIEDLQRSSPRAICQVSPEPSVNQ